MLQKLLLLGVVVGALAAAGGVAYAMVPDASGTIHGCYDNKIGTLRVIDPSAGGACDPKKENALSWSQTGPQGPSGTDGTNGVSGYQIVFRQFDVSDDLAGAVGADEFVGCPTGKSAIGGGWADLHWVDAANNRHDTTLVSSNEPTFSGNGWMILIEKQDGSAFQPGESLHGAVYATCATVN